LDKDGRHVAYWVRNDKLEFNRLPRTGRNGRLNAFLLYGNDKRMDNVRGEPILSIVLQSLKEIDRYRDSVQRKAVINSMLAMFVSKKEDRPGTKPLGGGAVRKDSTTVTDSDGGTRTFNTADFIPGLIIDELAMGEEIKGFDTSGIDLDFPKFEEAIIQAIAWAMETPPEILRLAFSNNYSASQAAINEYKMFLNRERLDFGNEFCHPIYFEWLISETLNRKINAPGFLEAWRDPLQYEISGAWIIADWSGAIKPSTDIVKTAKGYKMQVDENFISRERACREVSGMKLSTVAKKNLKANQQLAESVRPLLELKSELSGGDESNNLNALIDDKIEAMLDDIAEKTIDTLASDAITK
jgi:capsid protein